MKIIQIIPSFDVAGAEKMCETLICEQIKENEVQVISLYSNKTWITENLEKKGVKIFYLDKKRGFQPGIIKKIKKIIKEFNPDIIHSHLYAVKYALLASNHNKKLKVIHTVHNIASKEQGKLDRLFTKFFIKRKKLIPVGISPIIKESIKNEYEPKFEVPMIFNGIDISKCTTTTHNDKTINIINVARFSEQKNQKMLVEAFSICKRKFDNIKLSFIGTGEEVDEVKDYVKQLGLEKDINFLGLQENVYQYLSMSDIFVLSSLYEGMPISLIEAMASSLVCVCTKVGGIADMLEDNVSGILVNVNANELANGLEKIISDKNFREKLAKKAKEKSNEFSSISMEKNYKKLYEEIINGKCN